MTLVWIRESIAEAAFLPSLQVLWPRAPSASKRKANAFLVQFHFATFTLLCARVSTLPSLLLEASDFSFVFAASGQVPFCARFSCVRP